MLRLLSALVLMLCALSAKREPMWIKLDTIQSTSHTPEGVWRIADGPLFEIRAASGRSGVYELVLLMSSDLSVPAGTLFGTMTRGADSRRYDARLLADPKARKDAGRGRERDFSLVFNDDFTQLSLRHYRKGIAVNFIRLVPYLFRVGIERHDNLPDGVVGASRCNADAVDYPIKL